MPAGGVAVEESPDAGHHVDGRLGGAADVLQPQEQVIGDGEDLGAGRLEALGPGRVVGHHDRHAATIPAASAQPGRRLGGVEVGGLGEADDGWKRLRLPWWADVWVCGGSAIVRAPRV